MTMSVVDYKFTDEQHNQNSHESMRKIIFELIGEVNQLISRVDKLEKINVDKERQYPKNYIDYLKYKHSSDDLSKIFGEDKKENAK